MAKLYLTQRAWEIKKDNVVMLSHITGKPESIFENNIGWVVVDDLRTYPRFKILPRHTFNADYPELVKEIVA